MFGYVVSLFGHREIENLRELEAKLERILYDIIERNDFVTFLIGRNGDFDECAASCIRRIQRRVGSERCELALVMPYIMANTEYYENYYDSVIVPDEVYKAHPKGAISKRNKWMVSLSNEVLVFVKRDKGGAYNSYRFAVKSEKKVTNLYEDFST